LPDSPTLEDLQPLDDDDGTTTIIEIEVDVVQVKDGELLEVARCMPILSCLMMPYTVPSLIPLVHPSTPSIYLGHGGDIPNDITW